MGTYALDQLLEKATAVNIDTSGSSWYDLWHLHLDMEGAGNKNPEARRACLEALRSAYERALSQLSGWSKPNQSWVLVDPTDSGQDAVYVHTPNPNKQNFPYEFDDVDWASTIPRWITDVFPASQFQLGRSKNRRHVMYWVRRK